MFASFRRRRHGIRQTRARRKTGTPKRTRHAPRTDNAPQKSAPPSACPGCQRRNLHALPAASIKFPPVIAALHALPIKPSIRKRYPTMRTRIPQRKRMNHHPSAPAPSGTSSNIAFTSPAPVSPHSALLDTKNPTKSRVRAALQLLRQLRFVNEIFINRHLKSPCSTASEAGPSAVASSYSNLVIVICVENRVGDILTIAL